MPRKGSVPKRDVLPDPVYGSKTVTKFINKVMLSGKKSVAQRVVYDAFDIIRSKTGKDPLEVFETALKNVMPVLEVRTSCRRCKLPGSYRGSPGSPYDTRYPLDSELCAPARREDHGRASFWRAHGCC